MAAPRYINKFESADAAISYTFPLERYQLSSRQGLRSPRSSIAGAPYAYRHRGYAPALKDVGEHRMRYLVVDDGAAIDTILNEARNELYLIGLGKLSSVDANGVLHWCWAEVSEIPEVTIEAKKPRFVPVILSFIQHSDWFSATQRVYQFDIGADADTFQMQNNGDLPITNAEYRLKALANVTNASGTPITDAVRRAALEGDGLTAPQSYISSHPNRTNLVTNGGFETNTTGWSTGGANTIAVSTEQFLFGAQSLKCTFQDNLDLAFISGLTLTNALHSGGIWVYIPTSYDGTDLSFRLTAYASIVGTIVVSCDMTAGARDDWQWVTMPSVTPDAGDLVGNFALSEMGSLPTAGEVVYLDGCQMELGGWVTDYIETDGGTAARTRPVMSMPVTGLNISIAPTNGYWVAFRAKMLITDEEMEIATGATAYLLWDWAASGTDVIRVMFRSGSGKWRLRMTNGSGSHDLEATLGHDFAYGDDKTFIAYWEGSNMGFSIDGAAFDIEAQTNTPAGLGTLVNVLCDTGGTSQPSCGVHWMAMGTGIPTDAQAVTIDAMGNTDPSLDEFPTGLTCERVYTGDGVGAGVTYFTNPNLERIDAFATAVVQEEWSSTSDGDHVDDELIVDAETGEVEFDPDGAGAANDLANFSRGSAQVAYMTHPNGPNYLQYQDGGTPNALLEVRFYDSFVA